MSFYHKKNNFYSREANGYRQQITICLHNGKMSPNKNGDTTYTIREHITQHSSGVITAFKSVYELITFLEHKKYRFNINELVNFDRELLQVIKHKHIIKR